MGHFKNWNQRIKDGDTPTPAKAPAPKGKAAAQKLTKPVEQEFVDAVAELKAMKKRADKEAWKKELVPKFRPHVEGLLNNGLDGGVFAWWIVWLIDVGEIAEFIDKGLLAARAGWKTIAVGDKKPLERDMDTFVFGEALAWCKAEAKAGRSVEPYFGRCYARVGDMIDAQAADYHVFAGDQAVRQAEAEDQAPNDVRQHERRRHEDER